MSYQGIDYDPGEWSENWDREHNPNHRLEKAMRLLKTINDLDWAATMDESKFDMLCRFMDLQAETNVIAERLLAVFKDYIDRYKLKQRLNAAYAEQERCHWN